MLLHPQGKPFSVSLAASAVAPTPRDGWERRQQSASCNFAQAQPWHPYRWVLPPINTSPVSSLVMACVRCVCGALGCARGSACPPGGTVPRQVGHTELCAEWHRFSALCAGALYSGTACGCTRVAELPRSSCLWTPGCASMRGLSPAAIEGRSRQCWSWLHCLRARDKELTPVSKELIGPPVGLEPKSIKSTCGSLLTAIGFCVQALTGLYTHSNAAGGLCQSLALLTPVN